MQASARAKLLPKSEALEPAPRRVTRVGETFGGWLLGGERCDCLTVCALLHWCADQ